MVTIEKEGWCVMSSEGSFYAGINYTAAKNGQPYKTWTCDAALAHVFPTKDLARIWRDLTQSDGDRLHLVYVEHRSQVSNESEVTEDTSHDPRLTLSSTIDDVHGKSR